MHHKEKGAGVVRAQAGCWAARGALGPDTSHVTAVTAGSAPRGMAAGHCLVPWDQEVPECQETESSLDR